MSTRSYANCTKSGWKKGTTALSVCKCEARLTWASFMKYNCLYWDFFYLEFPQNHLHAHKPDGVHEAHQSRVKLMTAGVQKSLFGLYYLSHVLCHQIIKFVNRKSTKIQLFQFLPETTIKHEVYHLLCHSVMDQQDDSTLLSCWRLLNISCEAKWN